MGYLRARSGTVALISMQRDAERIEVQGRHVVALDDGNAYLAAGVAGMGVLWLPQYMANDHAARGELVPLFDGWSFDAMPMYVAFPSNRHVSGNSPTSAVLVPAAAGRHHRVMECAPA